MTQSSNKTLLDKEKLREWLVGAAESHECMAEVSGEYGAYLRVIKEIAHGAFDATEANQLREERDEYKKLLHDKHDELCKVSTLHGKEIERWN